MGSMFTPDAPTTVQAAASPPPTMPDTQSPDAMAAKRRAQQDVMGRAGRSSTILSNAMSRGDSSASYGATKLGAGT
ncbi:hypothetical protein ACVWXN_003477 [Bradyrhizobium sp. i1.4.4]